MKLSRTASKLQLSKETLRSLGVKSAVRTGLVAPVAGSNECMTNGPGQAPTWSRLCPTASLL